MSGTIVTIYVSMSPCVWHRGNHLREHVTLVCGSVGLGEGAGSINLEAGAQVQACWGTWLCYCSLSSNLQKAHNNAKPLEKLCPAVA